jgi:hypothetical protein
MVDCSDDTELVEDILEGFLGNNLCGRSDSKFVVLVRFFDSLRGATSFAFAKPN